MIVDFLAKVKECVVEKHLDRSAGNTLRLEETAKGAICREVYLNTSGIADRVMLILDLKGSDIHPLLRGTEENPGLKAQCDYVIVCSHKDKVYVIVAELKSNKPGKWRNQTVAGECLAHYVLSTIDRLNGTNYRASFEYRHILFTSNSQLRHKAPTGNKPLRYMYDSERGVHFTIQGCNNSVNTGFPLRNFLVPVEDD